MMSITHHALATYDRCDTKPSLIYQGNVTVMLFNFQIHMDGGYPMKP